MSNGTESIRLLLFIVNEQNGTGNIPEILEILTIHLARIEFISVLLYIGNSMKAISLFALLGISFLFSEGTPKKYWIYFTSKDPLTLSKSASPTEIFRSTGITERALRRRAKMHNGIIAAEDLPVSQSYLQQLKSSGIRIENSSRWFNAATAYLTAEQIQTVKQFSFVKEVAPVQIFKRGELPEIKPGNEALPKSSITHRYDYGQSLNQMTLINAAAVHDIGISGRGVLVGMLDSGFRWRTHEAMQHLHVIAEYDFIQKDSVTENQDGDASNQDSHGTSTMSLVGGYTEGVLVSSAFNADFILGKTEYVPTETNVEEDNWVVAMEWMEQQGVDVVSSSLGYSEFDATDANGNPQHSYTYADMNGKTATTTKAAAIAARKGVVIVNAMGNEAQNAWHYLTAPADADSIIAVGAVSPNGFYASFSSVGPTSDGRIKPDVSTQGVSVSAAVPGKLLYTGSFSGTSAATPLAAGVAAMLLSAHPELTPVQVRNALRTTASRSSSPNDSIGWGIINAYEALLSTGLVIGTDPEVTVTTESTYAIGMYAVSKSSIKKDFVKLFYSTDNGATFDSLQMILSDTTDAATFSGKYSAVIPGVSSGTEVRFFVRAADASTTRTSPFTAPAQLYSTTQGLTSIKKDPPLPVAFALKQNFPNPFNPTTTIEYDLPAASYVTLKVFDLLGREIATLVNGIQQARTYIIPFNASSLSTGVYFYRLHTPTFSQTKKMVLVR